MTGSSRRLELLATADAIDPGRPEAVRVVLDSAWTPDANVAPGILPIRPIFGAVVEARALFADALALVDAWAEESGAVERLTVDGVSYWFRMREPMWHWVHERLLWRASMALLEESGPYPAVKVPAAETALVEVLAALGRDVETSDVRTAAPSATSTTAAGGTPSRGARAVSPARPPLYRLLRRIERGLVGRPSPSPAKRPPHDPELGRRNAILDRRIDALLATSGRRAIVLTLPASYQRFGGGASGVRRDPNLGSVIPALRQVGIDPVVIGWDARASNDDDWALAEGADQLLPADVVRRRWGRPEDADRSAAAAATLEAGVEELRGTPLRLDGLDVGGAFVAALRATATRIVAGETRELAALERMMADVRPAALITTQEHHRTPWLVAARGAGVATFAVQHGVLYPAHPGYPGRRRPGVVLPDLTFVFGDYERRVLLGMGYREDEVAVSGSPRLDLDAASSESPRSPEEVRAVRAELGVREGDRLLVVSSVPATFVRRAHFVHMLERVLGGPLPGVHLVVKQHPGERDAGPYRELFAGLARAGAYAEPPVTVVRDVDLYRLLRAGDAHLGLQSTVLTDAVIAGTDNLIARVEPGTDLLGYEAAGVAVPVASPADVLDALAHPRPPSPADRAAFLADHYRDGPAGRRIAEAVLARSEPGGVARPGVSPVIA